jgi:hypothetical protein
MKSHFTGTGASPEIPPALSPDLSRLSLAATLTVLASVTSVLVIRALAVAILHPGADFAPLQVFPPIFDTVIGASGAVFVFRQICEYSSEPIRTYRRVAAGVLLVSFVPDIAFAVKHVLGANWPEASALMSMHLAVWAICVTLLPRLVTTKGS